MMLWFEKLRMGVNWISRIQSGTVLEIATSRTDTSNRTDCSAFGDEQSKITWERERARNCKYCSLVKEHVVKQAK